MATAGQLDPRAAAWVLANVPRGRRVARAQRLTGGLTSEVTGVDIEDAAGVAHRLVLRRWTGQPWPDGSVDDGNVLVPREAHVLSMLESTSIPAPRVVARDASGAAAGRPALLMTRLPGRLDLVPTDPAAWTRQLAGQLAAIHDVRAVPGLAGYDSWLHLDRAQVPVWSTRPDLWREALARVRDEPLAGPDGFVHHDYQQFNVVWSRGRLRGVVDWVWASQGPTAADVAHCRLNLCLVYGAARAVAFQTAYEAVTGCRFDSWWDVAGVVGYLSGWHASDLQRQAGRRLRVPPTESMRTEVEALLGHVLVRPG